MSFASCFLIMIAVVLVAYFFDKYPLILNWIEAKAKAFFETRRKKTETQKAVNACDRDAGRIFLNIINSNTIAEARTMKKSIDDFKKIYSGSVPLDVYKENLKQLEEIYAAMTDEEKFNEYRYTVLTF